MGCQASSGVQSRPASRAHYLLKLVQRSFGDHDFLRCDVRLYSGVQLDRLLQLQTASSVLLMGGDAPPIQSVAGGTYVLGEKLGAGSFGAIYVAHHKETHEEVAVKLEPANTRHPQVIYEAKVLKLLAGGVGIPPVFWYGKEGAWHGFVTERLGPSLEDLFLFCNKKFSLKTVLMIADQMLCRIEYVHSKNFIHRDLKPENFLMATGQRTNQINCIDFGLAKKYRDKQGRHIAYRENKSLTGTARYASSNTHLGCEQSRRDDLECLGFVVMYLLRGSLPWQGLRAPNRKQKYEKICFSKLQITVADLCKGHDRAFVLYFEHVRQLSFEQAPDYTYLRRIMRDLFVEKGFSWDYIFDWTLKKAQQVAGLRSVYGTTSKLIHYSSKLQEADGSQDAQEGANSEHVEGSLKNVECA
eukprot:jgi/Ulvmu1/5750/UM025_0004.1